MNPNQNYEYLKTALENSIYFSVSCKKHAKTQNFNIQKNGQDAVGETKP